MLVTITVEPLTTVQATRIVSRDVTTLIIGATESMMFNPSSNPLTTFQELLFPLINACQCKITMTNVDTIMTGVELLDPSMTFLPPTTSLLHLSMVEFSVCLACTPVSTSQLTAVIAQITTGVTLMSTFQPSLAETPALVSTSAMVTADVALSKLSSKPCNKSKQNNWS
jgi:hypothetical protein